MVTIIDWEQRCDRVFIQYLKSNAIAQQTTARKAIAQATSQKPAEIQPGTATFIYISQQQF